MVSEGFCVGRLQRFAEDRAGRLLLLVLGGALTGLTLIYNSIGLLEWLTLIPAAYVLVGLAIRQDTKLRYTYGYGFAFFMSFYLVIYHWFNYLYPLEFTGMSRASAVVVVLAGWVGLSIFQSLSGGLIFVFYVLLGRTGTVRRHRAMMPFLAASLWVVFEWSQTQFWTGVPWGRLAVGQCAMPAMIGTASLLGSYIITFFLVSVNFSVALAMRERAKARVFVFLAAGMFTFNAAAGGLLNYLDAQRQEGKITAAVIQPNIGSGDKWDMGLSEMIDITESYTLKAAASGPDLIIWPETAVPVVLESSPNTTRRLSDMSVGCGIPILAGMFTEDQEGREYNSLVLFEPDGSFGEQVYSKRRLVPFAERMPWRRFFTFLIPPLTEIAMLEEDVYPGRDSGLIEGGGVVYGPLICFDSIYESLTIQSLRDGAQVLVISTNDSWFYDSAAGRMHVAQAKLRAVESRRWVLRAANTGVSAVITPSGQAVETLRPLVGGYIVAEAGVRDNMTLYMRVGNIIVAAAALFCLLPVVMALFSGALPPKIILQTPRQHR